MHNVKTLVVYYSRTGTTERVGKIIAEKLSADTEAIIDKKDRSGVLGFIGGGKDALLGKDAEIEPIGHDPSGYDLIIVGTPVWASSVCPAVRRYLVQESGRLPQVAFFLTTGGTGMTKTFQRMAEVCEQSPVATLALKARDVKKDRFEDDLEQFVGKIRASMQGEQAAAEQ
jgi:flavodoxin